jgi:hypothetical protein
VFSLNDAVLDSELVQACGALVNQFFAVGEEEAALALLLYALDHRGCDGGLACASWCHEGDAPDTAPELLAQAFDAGVLVVP